MSTQPIFVRSIAYELGTLLPLEQALAGQVEPSLLGKLHDAGFRVCAVAQSSAAELARAALASVLSRCGLRTARVDAVVYATCSFWGDHAGQVSCAAVRRAVLEPLGLGHAELCGVALAESGNFASALRTARNLLLADGARNVLLVTTDRVPARAGEYRAMPSAVTVNSDAAAACLVSWEAGPGFVLEELAQASSPAMLQHRKGQGLQKYLEIVAGLRRAFAALASRTNADISDYAALITNNYAPATLANFAQALGAAPDRVFTDNVARLGHAFAADNLINLEDLTLSGALELGGRVLVLSTGPLTWGTVSLRRC